MVKGFPLESAYHSEKLSQPGMLLLEHRVWFFNSYDSTTPFCPWWRRSYGISFFSFGRLEFVPALVNVHSIQFPHQSPFQVQYISFIHGGDVCYYQGPTQMNSTSSLLVNAYLLLEGAPSMASSGTRQEYRNDCATVVYHHPHGWLWCWLCGSWLPHAEAIGHFCCILNFFVFFWMKVLWSKIGYVGVHQTGGVGQGSLLSKGVCRASKVDSICWNGKVPAEKMAEVNIVGRPVLMWVLDYLSTNKEDSIFLAVPAPILKQYDIKKMLVRLLPQASWWANIADAF